MIEARPDFESPLSLNVVFRIPGEVLQPDWAGLRASRYSAKERKLMIQVALPSTVPPSGVDAMLLQLLYAAVDEAEILSLDEGSRSIGCLRCGI